MAVQYYPDNFDLDDMTTSTSTALGPEEFSTVETLEIEKGESITLGQGNTTNPLQAEGSATGDPADDSSTPVDITGKYRLVVINTQNNVVNGGVIAQGKISALRETRANSIDGDILPYTDMEVAEPYDIALQYKTGSGTITYSSSNSSFAVDGFRGEKAN